MKYIIIIIVICITTIFIYFINKKNNINCTTLPFGYQSTDKIKSSCKKNFYKLLKRYGNKKDIDITNKILEIDHKYAPTWGIKIDKDNNKEFEMYFYVYNQNTKDYENDTITFEKLKQKFSLDYEYKKNITMYSIDYHDDELKPNFYYFTSSDNIKDVGYSEKDGKLNNHYYRYFSNTIDSKYDDYIDKKLINYEIENIKTVFIADKLIRNYYGIYYDGINYSQLKYFINKYNFDDSIIVDFDKTANYSISVDFNKKTNLVTRIGIYGLLY